MQSRTIRAVIAGLVGALGLSITPAARSQYTSNFQDNIVSGTASNWSGNYVVGSNTFADVLFVQTSGVLADGNGYLGYETNGNNNLASVIGSGSVWSNSNNLYIGSSGVSNFLWISAGGAVVASNSYLGYNLTATNNQVLVSGPGSVWSNSGDLSVGYQGGGNTLTITGGGTVYNNSGNIGNSAGNNMVTVSGSGSVWSNSSGLSMGPYPIEGNSLTISNGGVVYSGSVSGFTPNLVVTGSGSVWYNSGGFDTGSQFGGGAVLIVADGGAVYDSDAVLASEMITGTGSVWSNSGRLALAFLLTIADGGAVYSSSTEPAIDATIHVVVAGPGSVWNNAGPSDLGGFGFDLTITNGGAVYSGDTFLSARTGSFVLVSGAGSIWGIGGSLGLGWPGEMTIADDGAVVADSDNSSLNTYVSGGGLYVTNATLSGTLNVYGYMALNGGTVTANQLVVDNSESQSPYISFGFTSGLLVTGGTFVTNGEDFVVGDGTNGTIFVLAGGFHSFADGLLISSNAFLTGCGTIDGSVVVDPGGAVVADCGGTLTFTGTVTNNGSIFAVNGTFINFYGHVINNGSLVTTNCSVRFWGGVSNYGSLALDPNDDSDGDGIPNGWKQQYFGHPLGQASDLSRAGDDPDGDGFSNLQEYLAGTDPTNSASYMHITSIKPQGSNLLVTWMMGPGKTNALQATAGAANGSYCSNSLADIFIVTNTIGTVTNYLDVIAATNGPTRYYRVRLVP